MAEQQYPPWKEMLDEFRAIGGTAENLELRQGRFGRGLFPRDISKPVRLHIPESLLIDVEHLVFENNVVRVGSAAQIDARARAFLEAYERDFSWGVSRHETEKLLQMVHDAPPEIRELLKTPFGAERWTRGVAPKTVAEQYFGSRAIHYKGRAVVMPIVELANHGHGAQYEVGNGIGLSGRFSGEILVRYGVRDPLDVFTTWGFASAEELFALSLPMELAKARIIIRRQEIRESNANPFVPDVTVRNNLITLSHMLLGHKKFPRLARGLFYKTMLDAGLENPGELFEFIQHTSRMQWYRLLAASESCAEPLGGLLRQVARYQLECMSHSIGARKI